MESTSLMAMDEGKMMERIGMAKFPQEMTEADVKLLAQVAITYGFDPLMGEVTLYQGRPFVSIDGRYRKAQETGRLDGVSSRPATKQEREDWQIPDGDYFFQSEVYVSGASHPFIGWGRVSAKETKPGSSKAGDTTSTYKPIQFSPQRMAEKRAEAQALRKAFHIPLPSVEDIGSQEYDIDSTARVVDTGTGEIKESTVDKRGEFEKQGRDVIEEAIVATEPEPSHKAEKPKSSPVKVDNGERDIDSITTLEKLAKALKEDFGMSYQEQWDALGITSWNDLVSKPSEAYKQVAAMQ